MNNYQKLLNDLGNAKASETLCQSVISRVFSEQKRAGRRRFVYAFCSLIASAFAGVVAVSVLMNSLSQSGFWRFISLIFSDSATVAAYWKQFLMSLLESFSTPEMIAALVCLLAALVSIKFLLKTKTYLFPKHQLTYSF